MAKTTRRIVTETEVDACERCRYRPADVVLQYNWALLDKGAFDDGTKVALCLNCQAVIQRAITTPKRRKAKAQEPAHD